ncbi:hypothetical protein [Methylosinus sporium]|uniref:hypothetical protein n=1 Tax=Methylosinus sporium TaxID=428 RepID=UPI001304C6DE|nr:hypothetical protein [Methylosinus sporium]
MFCVVAVSEASSAGTVCAGPAFIVSPRSTDKIATMRESAPNGSLLNRLRRIIMAA